MEMKDKVRELKEKELELANRAHRRSTTLI